MARGKKNAEKHAPSTHFVSAFGENVNSHTVCSFPCVKTCPGVISVWRLLRLRLRRGLVVCVRPSLRISARSRGVCSTSRGWVVGLLRARGRWGRDVSLRSHVVRGHGSSCGCRTSTGVAAVRRRRLREELLVRRWGNRSLVWVRHGVVPLGKRSSSTLLERLSRYVSRVATHELSIGCWRV